MASPIHIVTDSNARYSNSRIIQQFPVTILPNKIDVMGVTHHEDVSMSPDEILKLFLTVNDAPKVIPPSVDEYIAIYTRLSQTVNQIVSIHPSRELSQSWYHAREAAGQVSSSCEVAVIDSRNICAGQGMLVRVAGQAILDNYNFEDVVQMTRAAAERIYSVYYLDNFEYLQKNQIVGDSRAILGAMLKVKPFLSIEEGHLTLIEKVRTRSQAIERLVEFLVEFDEIDDATIVQSRTHIGEQTRTLQDRLSVEFPGKHFPYSMYSAGLASWLGTTATGVVVLESDMEGDDV